jgi:glycogen debranching enzyme
MGRREFQGASFAAVRDDELVRELWPGLMEIVDWHLQGTRYGIGVDPADGLLHAGVPGVQLTDGRKSVMGIPHRQPVEVNALWHHARW